MNNLPIETYESVVQQRDALAAENAELKSRVVIVPAKSYVKDMRCNVVKWTKVIDALSDSGVAFVRDDGELIAGAKETPVTDSFTRELMANGVESGAEHFRSRARCARGLGHHDRACFLDVTAEMFDEYAESLRKGINDAQ